MRCCSTDEILSVAGTRDGASLIVSVRASSDNWRIADSSWHFVCRPARRSRGSQITVLIQRDRANRAVSVLIGDYESFSGTVRTLLFSSFHFLQGIPAFLS